MPLIRKVLTGLDFSDMDQVLLRYTAGLCRRLGVEQLCFVYVQRNDELPVELSGMLNESRETVQDKLKQDMKQCVEKHFGPYNDLQIEYCILEGNRVKEIAALGERRQIELMVFGRKKDLAGSFALPTKMIRRTKASILFIPENAVWKADVILIPLDLTDYSFMALERAAQIADVTEPDELLIPVFAYELQLPMGFLRRGKSLEEIRKIMQEHAHKRYNEFMSNITLAPEVRIEPALIDATDEGRLEAVNRTAHERNVDMIVVGARLPNIASGLFMSHFTEKLIRMSDDIPTLVLRQRDKSYGIMDAIRDL